MDDSEEILLLLFEKLSLGDIQVLESLYDQIAPKIYGLALWRTRSSADASDVVQEVFLKLAMRGKKLGEIRHPLSYVLRMAHTACVDRLRAGKRESRVDDFLVVSDVPSHRDHAARLSSLLSELPDEQREALYLRYFVGLSFREISAATGISLFTAASRCRLAIRKLRTRFGEIR